MTSPSTMTVPQLISAVTLAPVADHEQVVGRDLAV
jgi:hypothetical protein